MLMVWNSYGVGFLMNGIGCVWRTSTVLCADIRITVDRIVITITLTIYIATGRVIFKKRAQLRAFDNDPHASAPTIENPFALMNLPAVTKVTRIEVTTEAIVLPSRIHSGPESLRTVSRSSFSSTRKLSAAPASPPPAQQSEYSRFLGQPNSGIRPYFASITADPSRPHEQDAIAGSTIPVTSEHTVTDEEALSSRKTTSSHARRRAAHQGNEAAWAYAKVAMLMFIALIVVWVPSTVNRVYSLIHDTRPLFALNIIAAAVLPLQGFWNAMIYIATSWAQCKAAWRQIAGRKEPGRDSRSSSYTLRMEQRMNSSAGDGGSP
ncbi:hypothetical protein H2201_009272 [Coniosporium apollinis]|uniref:G-protein coupled receptors family 1 profile domain-containing protein n=1 Tax=Coniosporium apollinis TaxID=61459 RepID=A0ABQ9NG53_9PEZI|nr:hypothetical protein H2201_009272 [Coniosporium apollinis]